MSDDYQRHSELVDEMFLFGLTPGEAEELEQIRDRLDDLEEEWYAPIIRKFEKLYPAPGSLAVPSDAGDAMPADVEDGAKGDG